MTVGILTPRTYRHTGTDTFKANTCPALLDRPGVEAIHWGPHPANAATKAVSAVVASRRLVSVFDRYETVFVPSQKRMVVDPAATTARVVPYVHDVLPVTTHFGGVVKTLQTWLFVDNVVECQLAICGSEATRRDLERRTAFDGETAVVYQGVDHLPTVSDPSERGIDLLYVGALWPRKDPTFVRDAMTAADDAGFDVASVSGSRHDLPGRSFVDVSPARLAELYANARFLLHPSWAEGFGRCPVEAQRYGCLPVARDLPINREVLAGPKAAGVVWIETVEEVVDALEATTPVDRDAARANAGRFTWSDTVEQLAELVGLD